MTSGLASWHREREQQRIAAGYAWRAAIQRRSHGVRGGVKMARPIAPAALAMASEVARLRGRGLGREAIANRLGGVSVRQVRRMIAELGIAGRCVSPWDEERDDLAPDGHKGSYTADDYLRDHAGEMGVERLAREIGRGRSVNAVRVRLSRLGLCVSDMRTDLTLSTVSALVGWSTEWLMAAVRRRELKAQTVDGVVRVWPSVLRDWICADVRRVRWERVAREDLLDIVSLIAGDWGVSDDAAKAGGGRRAGGRGYALGPSGGRAGVEGPSERRGITS